MMNVQKDMPELPAIKEKTKKEEEKVVPPPRQVDVVMKPGMMDPAFVNTGLELGSLDINDEGAVF